MNKQKLIDLLKNYDKEHVENFASYIIGLKLAKKNGAIVNGWIQTRTEEEMAILFERVSRDGLVFDGKHINLQSTGISYDYVAYKNKMLLAYPESKVDVNLVYEGDEFNVSKESGNVIYTHNIKEPFSQTDNKIIGGYCVISNKRGDFLTLLSKADIEKHRAVSKMSFIWNSWFKEMALKTVIKKACKQHFADVYENIENIDNDNYDLENPLELDFKYKKEIDEIKTLDELKKYYAENKGKGADFDKYISIKKENLTK